MFFIRNRQHKRDAALGLDLGSSQIKAAVVQRNGEGLELAEYAVHQLSGASGKSYRDPKFSEAIQQVLNGLKIPERRAFVSISCDSAIVCHAEFPRMPMPEIKTALKLNSARYLRRDFSNYRFDAVELTPPGETDQNSPKLNILVGGANKEDVDGYRDALVQAKVRPEVLELSAVSVINAFQIAKPEVAEEVVLLVDIGARYTNISFLRQGQPLITRIMHFGGTQLSEYIGQFLTLEPAAAEAEKLKMSEPVQELVRTAVSPLAREIRSSIDFFERQHDRHVNHAFACGGSACSSRLLELLSETAGIRCEGWNPVEKLDTNRLNGASAALAELAPSLAAAIGAAAARL